MPSSVLHGLEVPLLLNKRSELWEGHHVGFEQERNLETSRRAARANAGPFINLALRWPYRVIIYGVARASVMFWMLFLHSFSHLVVSNLLHVISNDYIVFRYHLC